MLLLLSSASREPFTSRAQLYRFMSIGYLCQFLSVVLMVMHLLVFALNGTGLLFLKWVGQLADVGSQAVLAGMLVLLVRDCHQ